MIRNPRNATQEHNMFTNATQEHNGLDSPHLEDAVSDTTGELEFFCLLQFFMADCRDEFVLCSVQKTNTFSDITGQPYGDNTTGR